MTTDGDALKRVFGIIVDLQTTVLAIADERRPASKRVSDGDGKRAFAGSFPRTFSMRALSLSSCGFDRACRVARLVSGELSAHLFLHTVGRAIRSSCYRHGVGLFSCRSKILRRACPRRPRRCVLCGRDLITWIGVGLQMTAKVFQHRFGMFSARSVVNANQTRVLPAAMRTIINAWIHNRAASFPLPGSSMGTGVSSVWSFDATKPFPDARHDRIKERRALTGPACQCRAVDIDARSRHHLGLAIPEDDDRTWRRLCVQSCGSSPCPRDGLVRRWCLHDLLAHRRRTSDECAARP